MQVTKEGIERIKSANDLAAVVSERGIELRKKGRQLVAPCPFHGEKTASFNVSSAKGLFHCFGCGVSGDVIGFVTKHDKVSFGGALETLARRAGLDLGRLMEERPRIQQRTPLAALTPPRNGKGASASKPATEGAPPHGAPPTAILSRVVEHYHRTFCEREDAQAYLAKRGLTDRDLLRVLKIGYADGSLLKVIPKDGEVREELVSPRGHHTRGARAPGRMCRRADPGPAHRPVDEPLRPGDEDPAALLPSRPPSRCPQLPGRPALSRGHPRRIHPRCAVLPPGRHLDRDPDLRHERLHAGPPRSAEARGGEEGHPGARLGRSGTQSNGRIEGEAGGRRHHGACRVLPRGDQGRERAARLAERGCRPGLPPAPRCGNPDHTRAAAFSRARLDVSLKRGRREAAERTPAHARWCQLSGASPLARARPPARHGEGDEGRGLPRGHDRPLRVEEPVPSLRDARARRSASRRTRSRRRSWRCSSKPRRPPRRRSPRARRSQPR